MAVVLEACHLSVGYGEADVVRDVSFTVSAGEIICIAGESGSGKSSLLKALLGLSQTGVRVNSGTISFGGKPEARLGRELTAVFQDPYGALNPLRKIEVQFYETLKSNGKTNRAQCRKDALEVFGALGLTNGERLLESYPHELSGGMLQRVAIALAALPRPKLLLVDEPTSALDVGTQKIVIKELMRLREVFGTAIIMVTHDLGVAARIADKIMVMHDGVVVEEGTTSSIFVHPGHPYTQALIASAPKLRVQGRESKRPQGPIVLEAHNVGKTYVRNGRHFKALQGCEMSLHTGEILGIVGKSGSGKSTFARQLAGLEVPTEGEVSAPSIQMVFQLPVRSFDPRMRIGKSLHEPLKHLRKIHSKSERDNVILEVMEKVGLGRALLNRFPHELSGGQCQRAAIARALCAQPEVLICDEITSALDVTTQAKIVELLSRLSEEMNMAVVFISHDLALVSEICHRVMIMDEGTCVKSGSLREVITDGETVNDTCLLTN